MRDLPPPALKHITTVLTVRFRFHSSTLRHATVITPPLGTLAYLSAENHQVRISLCWVSVLALHLRTPLISLSFVVYSLELSCFGRRFSLRQPLFFLCKTGHHILGVSLVNFGIPILDLEPILLYTL